MMSMISGRVASNLVEIAGDDHLETLRRCGGYYECPVGDNGERRGPLVGYAGKYRDDSGQMRQYVGDVYYNFARAEQYPHVLDWFVQLLATKVLIKFDYVDCVLGAPMGGIAVAKDLSRWLDCMFAFAEKKITALATADSREQSKLILNRHNLKPGSTVLIVEDVCNNFSTTKDLCGLVASADCEVIGIACELNRSLMTEWEGSGLAIPVVSLLHIPTQQYGQDDPEVAEEIASGNVVWKPKDEWDRLASAMEAN